jgi:transcriptional regulator with XRE-family HTH domain
MHDIGKKIRTVREGKGLSRKAFGDLVGVSEPKVQAIEIGKQRVDHETLYNIAKLAEIDVNWLLSLDGPRGYETKDAPPPMNGDEAPSKDPGPSAHSIPGDPMRLMFCSSVVTEEYERKGLKMSKEAHLFNTLWVYNNMMERLPDPTDGTAMEAALRKTRELLRKKLAAEAG